MSSNITWANGYTGITGGGYIMGTNTTHTTHTVTIAGSTSGVAGPTGVTWYDWSTVYNNTSPSLKVLGDAEFGGDVKIQGKSIVELLERLEARLGIIHPNKELEDKWEELRDLAAKYKKLEAEIKEKEKMWEILKR